MKHFTLLFARVLFVLSAVGLIPVAAQVSVETVVVGFPSNRADTNGFGAVPYHYAIAKYETTIAQYTTFLNAVARTDTHQLYNRQKIGRASCRERRQGA